MSGDRLGHIDLIHQIAIWLAAEINPLLRVKKIHVKREFLRGENSARSRCERISSFRNKKNRSLFQTVTLAHSAVSLYVFIPVMVPVHCFSAAVSCLSAPRQVSTVGKVLTLLLRLMRRSGRGRGCLVWMSSSGVFPNGGRSLRLLLRVSGSHCGGSSNGPNPN